MEERKEAWQELEIGGIIKEPGSSLKYKTGTWSTIKPKLIKEKCINCLFCYIYCPEGCVLVKNGKVVGINYDYCKGCGICVKECPKQAITMSD
jgi:pyruvate ferredoxin oxidoreductase delta subunit